MKPSVIVVDMIIGNVKEKKGEEGKIIEPLREFLGKMRRNSIPIVFACDSFLEADFIFKGRMKKHAIRGTYETRPLPELGVEAQDIILEKRRFSAFFKTDLDQTLRTLDVDTVLICGVNTHFCVLATAFDALSHDFYTIVLEDLSAAYKEEVHRKVVEMYRSTAIYPLFRVMKSEEVLKELRIT